jgi:hypothetical protein
MCQGLQGKSAVHTLLFICLISTMFVTILARRCRRYSGPTTILALGQNRSPNTARCRRRFRPGSDACRCAIWVGISSIKFSLGAGIWSLYYDIWKILCLLIFCHTIPSIIYEVIYKNMQRQLLCEQFYFLKLLCQIPRVLLSQRFFLEDRNDLLTYFLTIEIAK